MRPGETSDDRLDAYLDALLRGEEVAPEEFLAQRDARDAADGGATRERALPGWLQDVWRLVNGEADPAAGRAEDPVASDLPCERVGAFRLLRRIGEGGMGRVYLARQMPLGRLCAVKLLRHEHSNSPTAAARLDREGRLLAALRHESLLRVLDAGNEAGAPWIALELVPGRNLDERIADARPSVAEVLRWGVELADGLAHAHAAGIVHRDVKPSNVRITPDGRALLLDFGLARDVTRETLRLTHSFAGTPMYVAPEQLRGAPVDGRCDVYSLGATLYEALVGAPLFEGDSVERVLHAVAHEAPRSLAQRGLRVPSDVETVLAKALEKDPARRYATAAALRDDLRAVLELRPIQARRAGPYRRGLAWARRHRALVATAVVLSFVLAAVFVRDRWRDRAQAGERQREARALVVRARDLIDRYGAGRAAYERASFDLRGSASMAEIEYTSAAEIRRLGPARALVADYEALRVSLEEVPVLLGRAERLDAAASGAVDAWGAYWFQRWMDVRDDEQRALAAHCRARILALDPAGEWAQRVSGRVALTVRAAPGEAAVHLFRVERLSEPAGARYVPRPLGSPDNGNEFGGFALEVSEDRGPLRAGDLIVEVAGGPVRGSVLKARTSEGSRDVLWDRLLAVGDEPCEDLWGARQLVARLCESPAAQPIGHLLQQLQWASQLVGDDASDLDPATWCTPQAAVARGGMEVEVRRGDTRLTLVCPEGVVAHTTGAPLLADTASYVGQTPLEFPASEPGYYVALLVCPGYAPHRVSFHLDHACEHYARGLTLEARLVPSAEAPAGFVRVDVHALGDGVAAFWMQRYEVTTGEYLEFLRSDEARAALAAGALELPLVSAGPMAGSAWPVDAAGHPALPPEIGLDWPILGVSSVGARAYARWFDRVGGYASRGLRADLPTLDEWRWGAFGGDGRAYVHGPTFAPSWVKSRFTRPVPVPEPVGALPLDESPWGIHDLAGSAAEWVHIDDPWRPARGRAVAEPAETVWALCGGAWNLAAAQDFAIGRTRYLAEDDVDVGAGFRLVLREEPR
ncbi:MAG: bifunctional serine/threonine-protein kinase/formylglycine-generating enzyme family protein [Planctomycetota bacterium]